MKFRIHFGFIYLYLPLILIGSIIIFKTTVRENKIENLHSISSNKNSFRLQKKSVYSLKNKIECKEIKIKADEYPALFIVNSSETVHLNNQFIADTISIRDSLLIMTISKNDIDLLNSNSEIEILGLKLGDNEILATKDRIQEIKNSLETKKNLGLLALVSGLILLVITSFRKSE